MDLLSNPETYVSLLTLTSMEVVLGIDNIVFVSSYGPDSRFNDFHFDDWGEDNRETYLQDAGHTIRGIDAAGTANSFGRFAPHIYKGVAETIVDSGESIPATALGTTGHNRINEWRGVTSAPALNI